MTSTTEQDIPPRKPGMALWRHRDFLLLWSGQAISILGTSVSTLALPLLVLALTHSPTQAGFIAATQTTPYLLFSLPAGALVDRWNRKTIMILCDAARLLAYSSIPLPTCSGICSSSTSAWSPSSPGRPSFSSTVPRLRLSPEWSHQRSFHGPMPGMLLLNQRLS